MSSTIQWSALLWNAHSLRPNSSSGHKLDQLRQLSDNPNIAILSVTETWQSNDKPFNSNIPSFPHSIHYTHANDNKTHSGGVSIYSRHPIRRRPDIELLSNGEQCVWGEVHIGHDHWMVGAHYHKTSPIDNVLSAIDAANVECTQRHMKLLVMGDFNLHHRDWEGHHNKCRTRSSDQFARYLRDRHLTVLNPRFRNTRSKPTHKRGGVLDLFITNHEGSFIDGATDPDDITLLSDHYPVIMHAISRSHLSANPPPLARFRWNTDKADWNSYEREAQHHSLQACMEGRRISEDVQSGHLPVADAVESFWTLICKVMDDSTWNSVPQTSNIGHKLNRWWILSNDHRALLIKYRRTQRQYHRYNINHPRQYDNNGNEVHDQQRSNIAHHYRLAKREWCQTISAGKRNSWKKSCQSIEGESDGRVQWKWFEKTKGSSYARLDGVLDSNGNPPRNPQHAVNLMARHLATVCSITSDQYSNTDIERSVRDYIAGIDPHESDSMESPESKTDSSMDQLFSTAEVKSMFDISNIHSALGPDFIHAQLLRHAPPALVQLFTDYFNFTWTHGVLPRDHRRGDVCFLLKEGGDPADCNSYRPISLTSIVIKAMERLVLKRMMARVERKLLSTQAGFRRKHSCFDNIYELLSRIRRAWSQPFNNRRLPVAFIDFSKAFDRTWHDGILFKLHKIGIRGRAWRWVRAFLSDREIRVVNSGYCSDWHKITAGVPQGSVISPFLFIVYINDIIDGQHFMIIHILLYADDICIWSNSDSIHSLKACLRVIAEWAWKWKMVINGPKSAFIVFERRRKPPLANNIVCDNHRGSTVTFKCVDTYRYLGLHLTYNLVWEKHSESVINKVRRASYMIARTIHMDSPPGPMVIRSLVKAIVIPIISYGFPLWKPSKLYSNRIQSVLSFPLRRVLGLPRSAHIPSILMECGVPSILSTLHKHAILAYKRLHLLPDGHFAKQRFHLERWEWIRRSNHLRTWMVRADTCEHSILIRPVVEAMSALDMLSVGDVQYGWACPRWTSLCDDTFPRKDLRTIQFNYQRRIWETGGQQRLLQGLWKDVSWDRVSLPQYLAYDDRRVVATRARLRFDRTSLKEARRRHGERDQLQDDNCEHCKPEPRTLQWRSAALRQLVSTDQHHCDDMNHYLFTCEGMKSARNRAVHLLHYRASLKPIDSIMDEAIIAFTDGSHCPATRRCGSAAVISYPPTAFARRVNRFRNHIRSGVVFPPVDNFIRHVPVDGLLRSRRVSFANSTNNVAELNAVGLALEDIDQVISSGWGSIWYRYPIVIVTDSDYTIGQLARGDNMKSNYDLVYDLRQRISHLTLLGNRHIIFHKVKAHMGVTLNEIADKLAGRAMALTTIHDSYRPPPLRTTIRSLRYVSATYPCLDELLASQSWFTNEQLGPSAIQRSLTGSAHYLFALIRTRRV